MLKKLILTFSFLLLLSLKPAWAAVRCETIESQYGTSEVCVKTGELQLDKEIWDQDSAQYVDNLSLNHHRFQASEEVIFKLKITNTGDEKFDTVHVKDTLPTYLYLTQGDLEFDLHNLDPSETIEKTIKAKVVSSNQLPNDKSVICVLNTGEVWANGESDKDTSQLCIGKGITELPPTGPKLWQISLSLSLISALAAVYFLKQAKS